MVTSKKENGRTAPIQIAEKFKSLFIMLQNNPAERLLLEEKLAFARNEQMTDVV